MWGGVGLYGRPRPVPLAHILGKHDDSPTTGDHKGNKSRSQPLIVRPRPYGSSGPLPGFPAWVDAYWAQ
jgi:hypothetical protein